MAKLHLSFTRATITPDRPLSTPEDTCSVILAHDGNVTCNENRLNEGNGIFVNPTSTICAVGAAPCTILIYTLSALGMPDAPETREVDVTFPCIFRLDEVAFPPGARAYRHVHAGSGFRHLRWGQLDLVADDHNFTARPGDTWFEAAHSPVQATATEKAAETRFARAMVVPLEFEGKPTIHILDPADLEKPKRQVTHRHIDKVLTTWPYVDAG